jgi:SAM-dependent methyltransferase
VSSSPSYLDPVVLRLLVGETVLDVGCGYGRWGSLIRSNYWESGLDAPPAVDGFDAFEPNVELCRRSGAYRNVWQQRLPSALEGSWDTVLACEVIEHLEQAEVEAAVATLEAAARRRIVFTTPNWRYDRSGGDTLVGYNEFEAHHAFVSRRFFRQRGYSLARAGYGNQVRGARGKAGEIGGSVSLRQALQAVPRMLPFLATTLVAYKDL